MNDVECIFYKIKWPHFSRQPLLFCNCVWFGSGWYLLLGPNREIFRQLSRLFLFVFESWMAMATLCAKIEPALQSINSFFICLLRRNSLGGEFREFCLFLFGRRLYWNSLLEVICSDKLLRYFIMMTIWLIRRLLSCSVRFVNFPIISSSILCIYFAL